MNGIQKKTGYRNKTVRVLATTLMLLSLVFAAGCNDKPAQPTETVPQNTKTQIPKEPPEESVPQQTEPDAAAVSLTSLRQTMIETPYVFAAAYLGCPEVTDRTTPADPFALIQKNAYILQEDLPFLAAIPQERIIGETGEFFCIVPKDENATFSVNKGIWDDDGGAYKYTDVIYRSDSGDPILLFCNSGGEPDTQVTITDSEGTVTVWYPQLDDNQCVKSLRNDNDEDLFFDFSPYREMLMAKYSQMKDAKWVMPTSQMLAGNTWQWSGALKDGREVRYRVLFQEETLSVFWNDGIDETDHEYLYSLWELTYDEGFAILSIDFGEFAGVLRYNLLYHEASGQLYVGMDTVQEEMPIGWEPQYRLLSQPITPEPVEMVGTWDLAWTELEGYREQMEPGIQTLEITLDSDGLFWIDYIDNQFSEDSFYQQELVVFPIAIYEGCGNEQWSATVNYVGSYGTEYTLTLLEDGTLMMQRYWEMDGAPTVAYQWYQRVDS